MSQLYLDEVTNRLTEFLAALPEAELVDEMAQCEAVASASGYLNLTPRQDSPAQFSEDLLTDHGMRNLVEKDGRNRLAMSAETPSGLVSNLLPSDGHLD